METNRFQNGAKPTGLTWRGSPSNAPASGWRPRTGPVGEVTEKTDP